ncbi:hypothetical protein ACTMNS_00710, partial [Staphylococcus haemolyticus]
PLLVGLCKRVFNPKPDNLDRRFRIYRETLSRFSCAASQGVNLFNDMTDQVQLNLKDVTQYNQFVELSYDVQYD